MRPCISSEELLGRAQPVIPPNLYSVMLMNIIAWGPQVTEEGLEDHQAQQQLPA